MPKPPRWHKTNRPQKTDLVSKSMAKPINVKDLIQKAKLLRSDAAQFFDISRDWRDFLRGQLPAGLVDRVAEVARDPPDLTVYVESSAWSARLRYALAELEPAIRERDPAITRIVVRVRPAARSAAAPKPASARRRR